MIEFVSSQFDSFLGLAIAHHKAGRFAEADAIYHQILRLPLPEVIRQCQHAITTHPNYAEVYWMCGVAFSQINDLDAAIAHLQQAIDLKPDYVEALNSLGAIYVLQNRLDEALACLQKAKAVSPNSARVLYNLGGVLKRKEKLDEAILCYEQAIAIAPDYAQAYNKCGEVLAENNQTNNALTYFQQTLLHQSEHPISLRMYHLVLPVIYEREEQISYWRDRFKEGLKTYIEHYDLNAEESRKLAIAGISYCANFYLTYQAQNDLELQCQYGDFVYRVMAAAYPQWMQKLNMPPLGKDGKIRIGYISPNLKGHAGVAWSLGWIKHQDRTQFEIYSYFTGELPDRVTEAFKDESDYFRHIPDGFEAVCKQVYADRLHILVFPDIGMNAQSLNLAVMRLAPIQCSCWGHPITSGSPNIEYFLSGEAMEPDNAQSHYSETLVRLPKLGFCYPKPKFPQIGKTRADFQISENAIVYLCCQSFFKYLPQHDYIFAQIASKVADARFVFIGRYSSYINQQFHHRLQLAFAKMGLDVDRFCVMLPRQEGDDYLNIHQICDIYLDSIGWSGGNTSLEAIAAGLAVVTLPGEFMRGRHTYAMLKILEMEDTIARDEAEYIDIAVRLAEDPNWRKSIVERMRSRHDLLYDDIGCVRALDEFYRSIVMTQNADELLKNGIANHQSGRLVEAQQLYLQVLRQQPDCVDALHNLGAIACQQNQLEIGINYFKQALALNPQRQETINNLTHALQALRKPAEAIEHYKQISALCPERADIHCILARLLVQQERWTEATLFYQQAIDTQPEGTLAYLELSDIFIGQKEFKQARICLQKLLRLQPDCADAYWNLCSIFRQIMDFGLWRETAERYTRFCVHNDVIRAGIALIQAYCETGLLTEALNKLEAIELQVFNESNTLSERDIRLLYLIVLPVMGKLRDDLAMNSKFAKLIGTLLAKHCERALSNIPSHLNQFPSDPDAINLDRIHNYLRIGISFTNFQHHPIASAGVDAIQALAKLTPYLYLYAKSEFEEDDSTKMFAEIATKCNWLSDRWQQQQNVDSFIRLSNLIIEIEQDNLDVLIDLDALTANSYPEILRRKPAQLCVSWLGFDAPFISSDNYSLGDRHTHPPGIDTYYLETIIRLPNVNMAVSGFPSLTIDERAKRKSLKIRNKDIIYLCVIPSLSLNLDTVVAHIQILKSVPNSILLYQGIGDLENARSHYEQECKTQNVDGDRIMLLPQPETEAERRSIYVVADVLLDSYPQNGIKTTLEALWFNLPIVTRIGEQSFARLGYSFLSTLGITAGIAHSWDEYVEWGASLGQFPALRNSIKEQLIQSKQVESLSYLWNPSKLATDMYRLFAEILAAKRESDPAMYFELGNRSWQEGNITEATRRYRQAIALQPNHAEAWGNLGTALHGLTQLDEAIVHYQKSLEINPSNFVIQSNLSRALMTQGRYDAAIASYKKAIKIDPSNINPLVRIGDILFKRREYDAACNYFLQALSIDPNHAYSHRHAGIIYLELNQVDRAILSLQQALATDPTNSYAHFHLSIALLLKGELRTGFIEYEWRWRCQDTPNPSSNLSQLLSRTLSHPLWNGDNYSGRRLLILAEQGFGDIIQFIRYIPLVKTLGGDNGQILFECPASLHRLFEGIKDIKLVKDSALPAFDFYVPLLSLPRILGTTIDNIPNPIPYLSVPSDRDLDSSFGLSRSITRQLRIGLVWATYSNSPSSQKRSCPLRIFRRLLGLKHALFYSLQTEIASEETALFDSLTWQIVDMRDRINDFADTAAIIEQMDLVITIDTAVAHLAGALGKPVWVMLPFAPDWRWMLGREDSPWYPTMRLFRQWHLGDWEGTTERVISALKDWVD